MESRAILDGQISASSEYSSDKHAANHSRLNYQGGPGKSGGWRASTTDVHQWLQIDLGSQYFKVTSVATQGRATGSYTNYVTSYKLQYSDNGVNFRYYRVNGQTTNKVRVRMVVSMPKM